MTPQDKFNGELNQRYGNTVSVVATESDPVFGASEAHLFASGDKNKLDSALQDAASDGHTYGRKNGAWSEVVSGSGASTGPVNAVQTSDGAGGFQGSSSLIYDVDSNTQEFNDNNSVIQGNNASDYRVNLPLLPIGVGQQTALQFNGTSSYVTVPGQYHLYPSGGGPFQVECWIKNSTHGDYIVLGVQDPTHEAYYFRSAGSDGKYNAYIQNYEGTLFSVPGTVDLDDGNWHHLALVHRGPSHVLELYEDGVSAGTTTTSGTITNVGSQPFLIGSGTNEKFFPGIIDEVRILNSGEYTADFTPEHSFPLKADNVNITAAYWNFNEGSGNVLHDVTGNGNTGTIVGNPTWVTGLPTYGIQFNNGFGGAQSYVVVPTSLGGVTDFTVELWVKSPNDGATDRRAVASQDGSSMVMTHADNSRLIFGCTGGVSLTVQIGDTDLQHVAYQRSGTTATAWLNGILVATQTVGADVVELGTLWIGKGASGRGFNGVMDEVRISSTARYTTTFIPSADFAVDASTVAYWKFEEGTGTTIADSSGNGHDGTLVIGDTSLDFVAGVTAPALYNMNIVRGYASDSGSVVDVGSPGISKANIYGLDVEFQNNVHIPGKLTVDGSIDPTDVTFSHVSTPSNPASGKSMIYMKSDDNAYLLNHTGSEIKLNNPAWNQITGTQTDVEVGGFANTIGYIPGEDVPANETDPVFTTWLSVPPNVSIFTNDASYLVTVAVDGTTITGDGTLLNPLVASNVMVYPDAGIPVSTGTSWGTSISGASTDFVKGDGSLDSSTYLTSQYWTLTGSDIYNNSGGKVFIGSSSDNGSGAELQVNGSFSATPLSGGNVLVGQPTNGLITFDALTDSNVGFSFDLAGVMKAYVQYDSGTSQLLIYNAVGGNRIVLKDDGKIHFGADVDDGSGAFIQSIGSMNIPSGYNYMINGVPIGATPTLSDVLNIGNDADATQIKNMADPTDPQDAVTLSYLGTNYAKLDSSNQPFKGNFSTNSLDTYQRIAYDNSGNQSLDYAQRLAYDLFGTVVIDYGAYTLKDQLSHQSIDWDGRKLYDSNGTVLSLNYQNRKLYDTDGTTQVASWGAGDGSFHIYGKLNVDGGIDPTYLALTPQSVQPTPAVGLQYVDDGTNGVAGHLYYSIDGATYTDISPGGGSMVYPDAGIAVSTGSAWGTSISGASTDFVKGDGTLDSTTYYNSGNFVDGTDYISPTTGLKLDQTTAQTFTAGTVTGSGLLNVTSGVLGLDTSAYIINQSPGQEALALGYESTATAQSSLALGHNASATGLYSTAIGETVTASGGYSTAIGVFPYHGYDNNVDYSMVLGGVADGSSGASEEWLRLAHGVVKFPSLTGTGFMTLDGSGNVGVDSTTYLSATPVLSDVLTASSITPVADGTYTVGLGVVSNGTITVVGGIITAITEAA